MKAFPIIALACLPTVALAHGGHVAPHGFEWLDGVLGLGLLCLLGLFSFRLLRSR